MYWRQWLDLAGWVRLLYFMDFSQYKKNYTNEYEFNKQRNNVVNIVKQNIDARISKLWVSDYNAKYVVLWWKDYIEVELWWVSDIEYAKKMIWKTVQMTFKVPFTWLVTQEIKNQRQLLAEKILTSLKESWFENIKDYLYPEDAWDIQTIPIYLSWEQLVNLFWSGVESTLTTGYVYPKLITTNNSYDVYQYIWKKDNNYSFLKISVLFQPKWEDAKRDWKLLNWERFKMATISRAPSGESAVSIYFDDTGRDMFCNLTKKYLKKQMAIFIWNKMVTHPIIQAQICWWVAQITWRFTLTQAHKLAEDLNTWAMPISLKLEQEQKLSPILWEKVFKNTLIAAWLWVVLVFTMFLFTYWLIYAFVTLLSLIIFFIVLWWFIKLFWVVLSLSAIGAIILNIGMAVDANVIIFERIREEVSSWSSFITAVINWYKSSIWAIRDWNLTTGLIAFLLFMIWTNIFKGFWTMMIINIFIVLTVMVPAIPGLLLLIKKNR